MNYLLDTQVFIWADSSRNNLSPHVQQLFHKSDSIFYLSVASLWEMQIKVQIGKMNLRASIQTILRDQREQNELRTLVITAHDIWELANLPLIHRDPFDRLLIAQARHKDLTIISADAMFASYPVKVVW